MKMPSFTYSKLLQFVCGPVMLLPIGCLIAFYAPNLSNNGIGEARGVALFLDGSTDYGGTSLFAGTIAEYVVFGFLASIFLSLRLQNEAVPTTFSKHVRSSLWFLKFHIVAFCLGGWINFGADNSIIPNDFRNMFLWAALLYSLSILSIVSMHRLGWRFSTRLMLAPFWIVFWIVLGSDGNTAIAGQSRNSGDNPIPIVRGYRHNAMLEWHAFCDGLLGDIHEDAR